MLLRFGRGEGGIGLCCCEYSGDLEVLLSLLKGWCLDVKLELGFSSRLNLFAKALSRAVRWGRCQELIGKVGGWGVRKEGWGVEAWWCWSWGEPLTKTIFVFGFCFAPHPSPPPPLLGFGPTTLFTLVLVCHPAPT